MGELFGFFGNRRSRSIKLPQFREFFLTFPGHLEITRNSFQKKTFTKSLGGPWPPWLRHCVLITVSGARALAHRTLAHRTLPHRTIAHQTLAHRTLFHLILHTFCLVRIVSCKTILQICIARSLNSYSLFQLTAVSSLSCALQLTAPPLLQL